MPSKSSPSDSPTANAPRALPNLPAKLTHLGGSTAWEAVTLGRSGAQVWRLSRREAQPAQSYLKISTELRELRHEHRTLLYLQDRAPVPRVLNYLEQGQQGYLHSSALRGLPASDLAPQGPHADAQQTKQQLTLLAQALQSLHSLPTDDCPLQAQVASKKQQALQQVKNHQVDASDFDPPYQGQSAEALWSYFEQQTPPPEEPLVFCHGDACLPNFIVHHNAFQGWVDLGRAGLAQPWQDLALCCRSLLSNGYSVKERDYFLAAYGTSFDAERFRYYCLLDEFF